MVLLARLESSTKESLPSRGRGFWIEPFNSRGTFSKLDQRDYKKLARHGFHKGLPNKIRI